MNAVLYMQNYHEKLFIIKNPDPPFVPWIVRLGTLLEQKKRQKGQAGT